ARRGGVNSWSRPHISKLAAGCGLQNGAIVVPTHASPGAGYLPPVGGASWKTIPVTTAGLDPQKLQEAICWAEASERPWPRSFYHPDGRYVGTVEWNENWPG